jgi:hypothetical protein
LAGGRFEESIRRMNHARRRGPLPCQPRGGSICVARPDATDSSFHVTGWRAVGANARGRMTSTTDRGSFPPSLRPRRSFLFRLACQEPPAVAVQCRCRVQQTVPREDSTDLDHNPSRKRLLVLRGCSFTSFHHTKIIYFLRFFNFLQRNK